MCHGGNPTNKNRAHQYACPWIPTILRLIRPHASPALALSVINTRKMTLSWIKWPLAVMLTIALAGCAGAGAGKPISPPPSFAAPVILPPAVAMPGPTPAPPTVPPTQPPQIIRGRVVIDPGHGGKDPGAQIPGLNEANLNLAVSRAVAKRLSEHGVTVVLTRNSDVFIELADRAAAGSRADLFVSIHADFNPSPEKIGHSILLPQSGDARATQAGQYIDRKLTAAGSPSHIVRMDNRGLLVLRQARCPALLVEIGFLSNRTEAPRLASPAYQQQLAQGIADGILSYLANKR